MKKITLKETPKKNVKDGLLIQFDRDTEFYLPFAHTDIIKGQRTYQMPRPPHEVRKVIAVYQKIK